VVWVVLCLVALLAAAAIVIQNYQSSVFIDGVAAYQASAVGSLRTINTAEMTYSSTYTRGFSSSLTALAPGAGENPTADAAGLIDSVLASSVKTRYRFTYRPAPPDATGKIRHYTVVARPLKYQGVSENSYFTDETGIIRSTTEDRDATASDPSIKPVG
jgi:hypothetical protein